MEAVLVLPWPPSVNTYYRSLSKGPLAGRVLISEKGRAYRAETSAIMQRRGLRLPAGRLRVAIDAYPPDRRRRDLDNLLKAALDALVHGGAIEDDSLIDDLRIRRGEVRQGGELHILIKTLEP